MPVTMDHMRFFILACTEAFSGKRGRSGVLGYLRGDTTPSTVELGKQKGIANLYGLLKGVDAAETHSVLAYLLQSSLLEIKKVETRGTDMPLLFITAEGRVELQRLD